MSLQLRHVLRKGDFDLKIDAEIPAVGTTGIFGPSGSGKTTLLRCIAGLEADDDSTPVHSRRIGYVTQQPQLFPHLNVRENLEYGAKRSKHSNDILSDVVERCDLGQLQSRRVQGLSGGEAQRVAIARALCQSPRILLMDEPLSAVDETRKDKLLTDIERIVGELDVPVIYVSHNIDEICRLCDFLVVLDEGRVVASGPIQTVLARLDVPALGGKTTGTVIHGTRENYDRNYDLTTIRFSGGEITVPGSVARKNVRLRVRATDVSLSLQEPASTSVLNVIPALVDEVVAESSATALVRLQAGDDLLISRLTRRSIALLNIEAGQSVFALVKSVTVRR